MSKVVHPFKYGSSPNVPKTDQIIIVRKVFIENGQKWPSSNPGITTCIRGTNELGVQRAAWVKMDGKGEEQVAARPNRKGKPGQWAPPAGIQGGR